MKESEKVEKIGVQAFCGIGEDNVTHNPNLLP